MQQHTSCITTTSPSTTEIARAPNHVQHLNKLHHNCIFESIQTKCANKRNHTRTLLHHGITTPHHSRQTNTSLAPSIDLVFHQKMNEPHHVQTLKEEACKPQKKKVAVKCDCYSVVVCCFCFSFSFSPMTNELQISPSTASMTL